MHEDSRRLLYLSHIIDGCFDKNDKEFDIHEQACIYASAFGREEQNDDDLLAAARDCMDIMMGIKEVVL